VFLRQLKQNICKGGGYFHDLMGRMRYVPQENVFLLQPECAHGYRKYSSLMITRETWNYGKA
jgi:hypothetical protein